MGSIHIVTNQSVLSEQTKKLLVNKLDYNGFELSSVYDDNVELVICIGGDGSFLATLHKYDFPDVPFIGINTGHLGFFQELLPDQLDFFIENYKQGRYETQCLKTVCADFEHEGKKIQYKGLNEIVIKAARSLSIHLDLAIGDSFIERFSGDGLLIATPAGSTAYNYALGGSIVDPRLNLLQVTPIAPMNTTAYRSFTSSLLLPPDLAIKIYHDEAEADEKSKMRQVEKAMLITCDGIEHTFNHVSEISIGFSETIVRLLRFENYDFWSKVKSKFL